MQTGGAVKAPMIDPSWIRSKEKIEKNGDETIVAVLDCFNSFS